MNAINAGLDTPFTPTHMIDGREVMVVPADEPNTYNAFTAPEWAAESLADICYVNGWRVQGRVFDPEVIEVGGAA